MFTRFSTVKPKCLNNSLAGPDAPNPSIDKDFPLRPTYLPQPKEERASTEIRFSTEAGSTLSRYSLLCISKTSIDGMETTRTALPSALKISAAFSASSTSEPVAMKMSSGVFSESERI